MARADDEDEIDESPDESDIDDSDSADTQPCPFCGKLVYDQADVCPHCGSFLPGDNRPNRKPLWMILAAIALLAAIAFFWLR